MPTGQVKWFDPKKGYGFIVGPEGQDVFVHYSQIQTEGFRTLKDGEQVDYELVQGEKGWQARNVSPSGRPPAGGGGGASPGSAPAGGYQGSEGSQPTPPRPSRSGYEGSQ